MGSVTTLQYTYSRPYAGPSVWEEGEGPRRVLQRRPGGGTWCGPTSACRKAGSATPPVTPTGALPSNQRPLPSEGGVRRRVGSMAPLKGKGHRSDPSPIDPHERTLIPRGSPASQPAVQRPVRQGRPWRAKAGIGVGRCPPGTAVYTVFSAAQYPDGVGANLGAVLRTRPPSPRARSPPFLPQDRRADQPHATGPPRHLEETETVNRRDGRGEVKVTGGR